ncbi:MAG: hypothetical protein L3V56_14350 [Candidatus Magnetoovum sp. WYHC-5]|nr:hypothetical protein [Candidatus Magnetoovum sp. WYHC-5]
MEGYCTACIDQKEPTKMASNYVWQLIAKVSEFMVANAEACPLVLVPAASITPMMVLATFSIMSLAIFGVIARYIAKSRTRSDRWESFIHVTTCDSLGKIESSKMLRAGKEPGDFGPGVYLAHDLYGRKFPDDKVEITQMFNIQGKIVETYLDVKVNVSRMFVFYYQNVNPIQSGVIEVVVVVFYALRLDYYQAFAPNYHYEYCK